MDEWLVLSPHYSNNLGLNPRVNPRSDRGPLCVEFAIHLPTTDCKIMHHMKEYGFIKTLLAGGFIFWHF